MDSHYPVHRARPMIFFYGIVSASVCVSVSVSVSELRGYSVAVSEAVFRIPIICWRCTIYTSFRSTLCGLFHNLVCFMIKNYFPVFVPNIGSI